MVPITIRGGGAHHTNPEVKFAFWSNECFEIHYLVSQLVQYGWNIDSLHMLLHLVPWTPFSSWLLPWRWMVLSSGLPPGLVFCVLQLAFPLSTFLVRDILFTHLSLASVPLRIMTTTMKLEPSAQYFHGTKTKKEELGQQAQMQRSRIVKQCNPQRYPI